MTLDKPLRSPCARLAAALLLSLTIINPVSAGFGDVDGNDRLDLNDYVAMHACMEGPASTPDPECLVFFDADGDGDVDLLDLAGFQRGFDGEVVGATLWSEQLFQPQSAVTISEDEWVTLNACDYFDCDAFPATTFTWQLEPCHAASGTTIQHLFEDPGTYDIELTAINQEQGQPLTASVGLFDVLVQDELSADFLVYRLVAPGHGECDGRWEPIDLDAEAVQLGERVKFSGGASSGVAAYPGESYMFFFGYDNGFAMTKTAEFAYGEVGDFEVQLYLDALDEEGSSAGFEFITKTVHVEGGMHLMSRAAPAGQTFETKSHVQTATDAWLVSSQRELAWMDISNPSDLPAVQIVPDVAPILQSFQMATQQELLFIPRGPDGIEVLDTNVLKQGLSRSTALRAELPADPAHPEQEARDLAVMGDVLFVCAHQGVSEILAYDISDVGEPVLLGQLAFDGVLNYMQASSQNKVLFAKMYGGDLLVIDVRDPSQMTQIASIPFEAYTSSATAKGPVAAALDWPSTSLIKVEGDATGGLTASEANSIEDAGKFALSNEHLYIISDGWMKKYNIVDPGDPYLQESIPSPVSLAMSLFYWESPTDPAQRAVFIGVESVGLVSVSP